LKKFKEEIQELGNKILQAALALHERVSSTFRKTAVNFHYEVRAVHQCLAPHQLNHNPLSAAWLWVTEATIAPNPTVQCAVPTQMRP